MGGEYGDGVLRIGGRPEGYYRLIGGSFGFLAGAQSQAVVLMFLTQEALDRFRKSNGWTVGADATVVGRETGCYRRDRYEHGETVDRRLCPDERRTLCGLVARRQQDHTPGYLACFCWRPRPYAAAVLRRRSGKTGAAAETCGSPIIVYAVLPSFDRPGPSRQRCVPELNRSPRSSPPSRPSSISRGRSGCDRGIPAAGRRPVPSLRAPAISASHRS